MLSLLTGSFYRRVSPSLFPRAQQLFTGAPIYSSVLQTRRTLHTTGRVNCPAAAAAKTSANAKSKSSSKTSPRATKPAGKLGAGERATKAKIPRRAAKAKPRRHAAIRKVKPIKRTVTKKKPTGKPSVRIAKDMLPPPTPSSSFMLFFNQFREGKPKSSTAVEVRERASQAGAAWKSLSEEEKKVFIDKGHVLREKYRKQRKEYFDNVDPSLLREINRQRVRKGKQRYHAPSDCVKRPTGAYSRFVAEAWREDAMAGLPFMQGGKILQERWHAMSDSEKAPYRDASKSDWEAHAKAQAARKSA